MTGHVSVPLHLAVHVLGLTAAVGLTAYAVLRRRDAGSAWAALALGGLLLALAHVITGALLAGEGAWPIYLRATAYAAIAIGAAGRMIGPVSPVVVVVAPLTAHVTAAVAGLAAAVAAVRGALGRGRQSLLLGGGLVAWAASDLVVRETVTGAGVLSVVGSVAVGAWLVARSRDRLVTRVVTAFVAVLLVLVVGLASAGGALFTADLAREQREGLEDLVQSRVVAYTEEWPAELLDTVPAFAASTLAAEIGRAAAGDVSTLDPWAQELAASLPGVDVALIVTLAGRVVGSYDVARAGALSRADELALAGHPVITRALPGDRTSGLVLLGQRDLLVVAAAPVAPIEGGERQLDERTGVLAFARRVTDPRQVAAIADVFAGDASLLIDGEVVSSSLPPAVHEELGRVVADTGAARQTEFDGEPHFVAVEPISGRDGQVLAELALTVDASVVADVEQDLTRSVFWAAVVGLLVAAGLAALLARRVTRPLQRLTGAAEEVAAGDLDTRVGLDSPDEIGRLATTFDAMTGALRDREEDLREAARTEADLRSRLETVTGSIDEALVAVDLDGRVVTANRAAAELLATPERELVGAPVADVLVGTDETGARLLDTLGGPGDTGTMAVRGAVGTGRALTPVAATAAPLRTADGERLGRVYVLRDVSGEAEVERMKTEFLSNISHELRTPLTPIKGYAEVLRGKELPRERVVDFAGAIAEGAGRLERIIGMLVDYAALEAGRVEIRLEPTAVGDCVDRVLRRWRKARPDREFARRIRRGLPEVQVDPDLLNRVLEELVDNAVKFSDDKILILGAREEDGRVRLTVRDRGQGMDSDQLANLTRDFHQADGSATRRYGGLGLGLTIVQRILDQFNAEVVVESTLDEGTDVHLFLPEAGR